MNVLVLDSLTYVWLPGDFSKAWDLLLEYIENSALCKNSEVSLAALKSFQEMLQIRVESNSAKDEWKSLFENPYSKSTAPTAIAPPAVERMTRSSSDDASKQTPHQPISEQKQTPEVSGGGGGGGGGGAVDDAALWQHAWSVWLSIGAKATTPPPDADEKTTSSTSMTTLYIPSQTFLTALIDILPPLYEHIKARFAVADLRRLCHVLQQALAVPVHSDSSPFILPVGDAQLTSLQQAVLDAVRVLQNVSQNIHGTVCSCCN